MCNINAIIPLKGTASITAIGALDTMGYISFEHNDDGYGYILTKADGKVVVDKSLEPIKIPVGDYKFMVSHQRYGTSGTGVDNAHPYAMDNLILMHNGIMHLDAKHGENKSDSYVYAEKLSEEYKQTKDIVQAIRNIHKDLGGWFSIVIYDIPNKRYIYYKNNSPTFVGIENSEYRILSTNPENVKYAQWVFGGDDWREVDIEPMKIYDMTTWTVIGDFGEPEKAEEIKDEDEDEAGSVYGDDGYFEADGLDELDEEEAETETEEEEDLDLPDPDPVVDKPMDTKQYRTWRNILGF